MKKVRLTEDNLPDWLEELQGPNPRKARQILLAKKNDSLATLLANWEQLPAPIRLWAFQEAVKKDPVKHATQIRRVLCQEQEHDGKLLKAALEALRNLPRTDADAALITPFYRHPDPKLRAAAIRIELAGQDWAALLEEESVDRVRVEIILRLGQKRTPECLRLVAAQLEDGNWRIRAAAAAAMVLMAPDAIPVLQSLFKHENSETRAAAAQALQRLDQNE